MDQSTPDFAELRRRTHRMSNAALAWTANDAFKAAEMVEEMDRGGYPIRGKSAGYYRDEAAFYRAELNRRQMLDYYETRMRR